MVTATEEFGIAAVEAQAAGRPVIALAEGGVCETVLEGTTGTLYSPGDAEALAEAVAGFDALAVDPAACVASAARFDVARFRSGLRRRRRKRRGAPRPARPHAAAAPRRSPGRTPGPTRPGSAVSVVIPNWNGRRWLPGCLAALAAQTRPPAEVVVVDNGSTDGSLERLAERHPDVRVLALGRNTGFAAAANRGIEAATSEAVALVNPDAVLAPDWLERTAAALAADPGAGAVACKMVDLDDPGRVYDAGDVLRRDGVCEQRGRFQRDDGRFDEPGEVFAACAGAALYRREAVLAVGGFDERFFAYLEDVDLGLRLRLAGWRCRYEPGRRGARGRGVLGRERAARRRLGRAQHAAARGQGVPAALGAAGRLPPARVGGAGGAGRAPGEHLAPRPPRSAGLPAMLRERRRLRATATVPVSTVIPARPIRASQGAR